MEESLLSDTDRPHDLADHGGPGEAVGKSEAEQGAETQETPGSMETGTAEGMYR